MERLTVDQILKLNTKLVVHKIDLDDPKNAHILELFEETRQAQEELMRLRDLPFENSIITI